MSSQGHMQTEMENVKGWQQVANVNSYLNDYVVLSKDASNVPE